MWQPFFMFALAVLATIASVAGPQRCGGASSHSCVTYQAECVGGNCVCMSPYVWGDGSFSCYKPNQIAAQVYNDPKLTNFENETIQFPFPCRYLITHIKQKLQDTAQNVIGTCEFEIFGFNGKDKDRGKFFVHGFDIATRLEYNDGKIVKMSSRNYGENREGTYTFISQGTKDEYLPDGPWSTDQVTYTDDANGVKLSLTKNDDNGQLIYEVENCGLRLTFVPYDLVRRLEQITIPGVAIGINLNHDPEFLDHGDVMSLAPVDKGGATYADVRMSDLTDEQSMVVRAFTRSVTHNVPYEQGGLCTTVKSSLDRCSTSDILTQAMKSCYWMLSEPRFIRCYDDTRASRDIMDLFSKCVDVWCNSYSCNEVKIAITDAGCDSVRDISALPKYLAGEMCPRP